MTIQAIYDFFYMGGHGVYVWSAYGMAAALAVIELFALRKRRANAVGRLTREARAVRATREI